MSRMIPVRFSTSGMKCVRLRCVMTSEPSIPRQVNVSAGKWLRFVPAHLCGVEIPYAGFLHNLRDSGVVTECVGEPERVGAVSEIFFRESLTIEELTYHGLAAGDVAVAFNPHAAVRFISALGNLLFDTLEYRRIVFSHPVEVERRGLNECVIRINIHERESFGIGSRALPDGFGNGPEPCGVHV